MAKFNVRTQAGGAATNKEEAIAAAKKLKDGVEIIVKAQVHTGGRGKGTFKNGFKSGVHFCDTAEKAGELTEQMVGQTLVTKQTGEAGILCSKVFVGESANLETEKYFAILLDRAYNGVVLVGSPQGGMDIEEVAESSPDAIFTEPVDIRQGPTQDQLLSLANKLEFKDPKDAAEQMGNLYKLFAETDCTMLEINPLAETDQGVMSADAKLLFDDNASFRQKDIFNYRDRSQEDQREVAADEYDLNYIGLDGSIGCMVNGAGLAMATMDIIKMHGGEPANFLDVGGGANETQVAAAFKILQGDPNVKAILVNIFGGIMKCDTIAAGIVAAAKSMTLTVPVVVRLEGTNVELGKKIVEESGLALISANDLDDAAVKAVQAIGK